MFENQRAWVRMPSGKHLDLVNPTPFDWDNQDLAIGLSRTYRWGSHSIWPLPMSVAQHSLMVLELRRKASIAPLSREQEMREVLHDTDEGLLGVEIINPIKSVLGAAFKQLSDRLLSTVFTRYGIPDWTPEEKKIHKEADILAAASEAIHVAGWKYSELRSVLGITMEPLGLEDDPLVEIYGGMPWEPWPAEVAAERFLSVLESLAQPMPNDQYISVLKTVLQPRLAA